eukprot:jgi/Ulvmu1/752/UM010_0126.1
MLMADAVALSLHHITSDHVNHDDNKQAANTGQSQQMLPFKAMRHCEKHLTRLSGRVSMIINQGSATVPGVLAKRATRLDSAHLESIRFCSYNGFQCSTGRAKISALAANSQMELEPHPIQDLHGVLYRLSPQLQRGTQ